MNSEADIMHDHTRIGRLMLSSDSVLSAREAGLTYLLGLSVKLMLDASGSEDKLFMLDRFATRVAVSAGGLPNRYVAEIPVYCSPTSIRSNHYPSEPSLAIEWHLTKPEFALVEKHRGRTAPRFEFTFEYTVQQFNKVAGTPYSYVVEAPEARRTTFAFQPSIEAWIGIIQRLHIAELILFEIPISVTDSGRAELNLAIKKAVDHFYHGGSLGFKEVVANIRIAMEKAAPILGVPPAKDIPKGDEATRNDRFYLSWYALKKLTHLAHHEPDEWSRDEAQYVLSSFLSLMNNLSGDGRCTGDV